MKPLNNDEIVEEIHKARQEHAARLDFDIDRIIDDLKRQEAERNPNMWPLIKAPEHPPSPINVTLQRMRLSVRRGG
jgi:hypothetical protein